MVDPVIRKYSESIKYWGYLIEDIKHIRKGNSHAELSDLARLTKLNTDILTVNPSTFFDEGLMLSYRDRDTALGQTE